MPDNPQEGGYTAVPNWLIDQAATLPAAAFKVAVVVCRLTVGWQKDEDTISLGRLSKLTRLSKPTLITALRALGAAGIVEQVGIGSRNMGTFRLVNNLDRSNFFTVQETLPDPVKKLDTQKKEKEIPLPTGEAPAAASAPAPEGQPHPDRPARTNPHPVALTPPPLATATPTRAAARQVPAEIEQPRLVDAEMPDPVDTWRTVCKVKKPNEVQRNTIRAEVTGYADEWRKVCEQWMLNGWNVRHLGNMLDAYQKLVAERRKADARRAETERSRATMAPPPDEQPVSRERARELFAQFRAWKEPATAPSAAA